MSKAVPVLAEKYAGNLSLTCLTLRTRIRQTISGIYCLYGTHEINIHDRKPNFQFYQPCASKPEASSSVLIKNFYFNCDFIYQIIRVQPNSSITKNSIYSDVQTLNYYKLAKYTFLSHPFLHNKCIFQFSLTPFKSLLVFCFIGREFH